LSECRQVYDYSEINCYIKHLKSKSLLSEDFPEHQNVEEFQNCNEYIESIKEKFTAELAKNSNQMKEYGMNCVIDGVKTSTWAEYQLLDTVYEASRTMTKSQKTQKIKESGEVAGKILLGVIESCIVEKGSRELFEELFNGVTSEKTSVEEESDAVDYCTRKYVVEKKLIDTTVHNFTINPKNINVTHVNCEEELKTAITEVEHKLKEALKENEYYEPDCMVRKMHEMNFIDLGIKIEVLSGLNISEKQKDQLRNEFTVGLIEMIQAIHECELKKNPTPKLDEASN
jgi:hypothetical protein